MSKLIDLTGQRFGRLTVIKHTGTDKFKKRRWECICDCGAIINVSTGALQNGNTTSCGCRRINEIKNANTTHGESQTRLYRIWAGIIQRTENEHNPNYDDYGNRGIEVCNEWRNDFKSFMQWSLLNGYSNVLSIDRIDNDRGYTPDNCRWVTQKAQCSNRRSNRKITYKGETKTLSEWADILHIKRTTLSSRIITRKWSVKKAFETPTKKE